MTNFSTFLCLWISLSPLHSDAFSGDRITVDRYVVLFPRGCQVPETLSVMQKNGSLEAMILSGCFQEFLSFAFWTHHDMPWLGFLWISHILHWLNLWNLCKVWKLSAIVSSNTLSISILFSPGPSRTGTLFSRHCPAGFWNSGSLRFTSVTPPGEEEHENLVHTCHTSTPMSWKNTGKPQRGWARLG